MGKHMRILMVAMALTGPALLVGCGGGSSVSSNTTATTTSPKKAGGGGSSTGSSSTTSPSSSTTTAGGSSGGGNLPVGAEDGFPFGSVSNDGTPVSLLPANADDVGQSAVTAAPRVGPFTVDPSAGPSAWPDACTLSSGPQLRALIKGATGLSGTPVGTKAQIIGGNGGNTPNNTDCKFNLTTSFTPSDDSETPSWVQITIEDIGTDATSNYQQEQQDQAAQAPKFPAQYANYPNLPNGISCFSDGNELQCNKGNYFYWIGGQKVTDGQHESSDQAVWIVQAELPLAEVLGTELK